jgi:hypothetical protein
LAGLFCFERETSFFPGFIPSRKVPNIGISKRSQGLGSLFAHGTGFAIYNDLLLLISREGGGIFDFILKTAKKKQMLINFTVVGKIKEG